MVLSYFFLNFSIVINGSFNSCKPPNQNRAWKCVQYLFQAWNFKKKKILNQINRTSEWIGTWKKSSSVTLYWRSGTLINIAHYWSLFLECELYNAILPLSQIDTVFPVKDTRRCTEKRGSLEVFLLSSIWAYDSYRSTMF